MLLQQDHVYAKSHWTVLNEDQLIKYKHNNGTLAIFLKPSGDMIEYRIMAGQKLLRAGGLRYYTLDSFVEEFIYGGKFTTMING